MTDPTEMQPHIEALEAENGRMREALEMVHADCIARAKKLPDGDFKVPVGASVWIAVCAALKGEVSRVSKENK